MASTLYCAAENAGDQPRGNGPSASLGKAKYSTIFNDPTLIWVDIGAIGWLVDNAAS